MELSQMKRRIISGALAVSMIGGISAFAAGNSSQPKYGPAPSYQEVALGSKELNVVTGINIYVDGLPFTPTDSLGNEVFPFMTNGTTYLPVRALANAYGIGIDWDNREKAVLLNIDTIRVQNNTAHREPTPMTDGKVTAATGVRVFVNGEEVALTDANGNPVDTYLIDGTVYLPLRAISNLLNVGICWYQTDYAEPTYGPVLEKETGPLYNNIYIGKIYHNVSQETNDKLIDIVNLADKLAPHLEPIKRRQIQTFSVSAEGLRLVYALDEVKDEFSSAEFDHWYKQLYNYVYETLEPLNVMTQDTATKDLCAVAKNFVFSYPESATDEDLRSDLFIFNYHITALQYTDEHYQTTLRETSDEKIQAHYETIYQLYNNAVKIYNNLSPDTKLEYK